MWGPNLVPLISVSVHLGRSMNPHMVYMIMILGPLWCSAIMPPPLSVWSVLFSMNMLITFRIFVGIIMSYRRRASIISCPHPTRSFGSTSPLMYMNFSMMLASTHLHLVGMMGLLVHPFLGLSKYNAATSVSPTV
jgi:hypothetical protein